MNMRLTSGILWAEAWLTGETLDFSSSVLFSSCLVTRCIGIKVIQWEHKHLKLLLHHEQSFRSSRTHRKLLGHWASCRLWKALVETLQSPFPLPTHINGYYIFFFSPGGCVWIWQLFAIFSLIHLGHLVWSNRIRVLFCHQKLVTGIRWYLVPCC